MYILDTDHVSVLDRGGVAAQRLLQRLANINPTQVATSIISYEEQMRGWLSYGATAKTVEQQVEAYKQLKRQLLQIRHRIKAGLGYLFPARRLQFQRLANINRTLNLPLLRSDT